MIVELPGETYGDLVRFAEQHGQTPESLASEIIQLTFANLRRSLYGSIDITLDAAREDGLLSQETARRLLRKRMGAWSEDRWCAGWLANLEFILWELMENQGLPKRPDDRRTYLSVDELQEFRALANAAGGWWVWTDRDSGRVFLPMDTWLAYYRDRDPAAIESTSEHTPAE